jgi:hypothetical protein
MLGWMLLGKSFNSLGPWDQITIVIQVIEPTHGLEGYPDECHLLKVSSMKKLAMIGDSGEPMATPSVHTTGH